MSQAKPITQADFETLKNTKGLVFLDFWAPWCGPCKVMSPVVDEMAPEFPDVMFGKVDVDEEGDLANTFAVRSIPTFYLLNLPGDGTFDLQRDAVGKIIGSMSTFDFKMGIENLIKKAHAK
jgi:thioredoxin 1